MVEKLPWQGESYQKPLLFNWARWKSQWTQTHKNQKLPTIFSNRGMGLKWHFWGSRPQFWDKLVGCGDETNCCTAESRISFCFVETSSTSLRSHAEFQGNFKDGWTKVVLVRAYFDATPLLHPFTTCPPQEDGGTVGKQKQTSRFRHPIQYITLGRLTFFSMSQELDKGLGRVRQLKN